MGRAVQPYKTPCGVEPLSFWQMLASCIITDESGNTYLNCVATSGDCNDYTPLLSCPNNDQDLEHVIVDNAFVIDECGHLALNLFASGFAAQ